MFHLLSLGIVLYIMWLLLSGHYEPFLLLLGLGSVIGIVFLANRMKIVDRESHPIHLTWRFPLYLVWLLWEVVKANIAVTKLIWHPSMPISPTLVKVSASQWSDLGRVIYANSITLTPGTVSVSLEERDIEVHAITKEMAADLESGTMDRQVSKLEGEP